MFAIIVTSLDKTYILGCHYYNIQQSKKNESKQIKHVKIQTKMSFHDINLRGKKLDFEIRDVDVSIVNALRRVILAEYPTVAIAFDPYDSSQNDINIKINTTALHNEFTGHRISLVPVHMNP